MSIFKNIVSEWIKRKKNSDIKKVTVTSSGAFYMKSEDLFNDDAEALALLDKLDKSVKNYKSVNKNTFHILINATSRFNHFTLNCRIYIPLYL
ncbi:hypothetical protein E6C50_10780 [Flavobacterium supellecticarium]|uniref:Uncharacterized protein n=1 Tax=Flavobacterium supellecticarium TaxID=2565924 RepID=A0A4S3ZVW1_9FLAO|nr:hypothetical protein [Flavobacterium supellecticarium]THF49832.1 hypothetical protein E6C50_10780 [Flavobacterium supellecticarium]